MVIPSNPRSRVNFRSTSGFPSFARKVDKKRKGEKKKRVRGMILWCELWNVQTLQGPQTKAAADGKVASFVTN